MRLTENLAKARLASEGLPVPEGKTASSPAEAAAAAVSLGGKVVVKALVPANRRALAGGVIGSVGRGEVTAVAEALLGSQVAGFPCDLVYVEQWKPIQSELYLAFSFDGPIPTVRASAAGGVDVEGRIRDGADIASRPIDPLSGLDRDDARGLWDMPGVADGVHGALVELTLAAARVFADDALMLELNPIAVTGDGSLFVVGALMEVDDAALFRHPELEWAPTGLTPREALVAEANVRLGGPAVRYVELAGDIGLLVGGGGAGLYQHDLLVAAGAQPANHSDMAAGAPPEKLDVLVQAVLGHPQLRRLLVGFNTLQMARCDIIIERLLAGLGALGSRGRDLPIVVRLDGLDADRARALAAGLPSLTYLPRDATLSDAVAAIAAEG